MIRALYALAATVILTVSLSTGLKVAAYLQTQPSPAGTATSTAPAPAQSPTASLSPPMPTEVLLPSEQPTEAPTPLQTATEALPTAVPPPLQSQQPIATLLPTPLPTPLPTLVPTPVPTPEPTPCIVIPHITICFHKSGHPFPTPPPKLDLQPVFLPLVTEDSGCRPEPITPNTPTGIAGCVRFGTGTASFYTATGLGAAMNFCTWTLRHSEGCGTVQVTALATGISVRIPIVDFCDCYTGTRDERIIDLQGGVVGLLDLNPAQGLWKVEVSR